jgi:predicted Zn-dependent protease
MDALEYPDTFYLRAAQGWLELGNSAEALAELNAMTEAARNHPQSLELRWEVALKTKGFEEALAIAEALCQHAPASSFGGIHRSYCLHELKRTQEAWDTLLPLAEIFPQEWLICYNLACYACQLGRLAEGRTWFSRALKLGDSVEVKALAAEDPDLKPLFASRPV